VARPWCCPSSPSRSSHRRKVTDLRLDFAAFDRLFHLPARASSGEHLPQPLRTPGRLRGGGLGRRGSPRDRAWCRAHHPLGQRSSLDNTDNAVAASVAALRLGAKEGGIISLSPAGQIGGEHCVDHGQVTQLNAALEDDAAHHVTVVAATGDVGAAGEPCALITALGGTGPSYTPRKEVILVASDPLVLSVGAPPSTRATRPAAWIGESAWAFPTATRALSSSVGRGFSRLFARPSYQNDVAGIGAMRGVPDVAADANPHTGFPVVTSDASGSYTISGHGGTSAAAPTWAAIIALADQYAKRHVGFVNPAIYQIARSSHYHQAFHDITVGNNTAEFSNETITGYRAGRAGTPSPAGAVRTPRYLFPARSLREQLTKHRSILIHTRRERRGANQVPQSADRGSGVPLCRISRSSEVEQNFRNACLPLSAPSADASVSRCVLTRQKPSQRGLLSARLSQNRVEVAGVEPASPGILMGLLRAHPAVVSRVPPRHRRRCGTPATEISLTARRRRRSGKPCKMTPGPVRRTRTGRRCC